MSPPENLAGTLPVQICPDGLIRPMSLDLDLTESKRMCYPSNLFDFDTVNGHTSSRITSLDKMTYSHYVRDQFCLCQNCGRLTTARILSFQFTCFSKLFSGKPTTLKSLQNLLDSQFPKKSQTSFQDVWTMYSFFPSGHLHYVLDWCCLLV